jgi:3-hydroxyethyl bacteriochlorophyllide a dehydrogenase
MAGDAVVDTIAVVLEAPEQLSLRTLDLRPPEGGDVVVDVQWSGISTGTERLLWSGRMPDFPGMGYPLVPGYESVGRVVDAGPDAADQLGKTVFIPGSTAFVGARGLFGGAARRLVAPASRVVPIAPEWGEKGVLLALAATARHAIAGGPPPELIVGHGVLGRLLARIVVAEGHPPPVVWETDPARQDGATGYAVLAPEADARRDFGVVMDASGAPGVLDLLMGRLRKGGEIVLAGFYDRLSFAFPPAFMREARIRVAAEWTPADLDATRDLIARGALSLDGLVTHARAPVDVAEAYRTAFTDASCLKMVLDWRGRA